MADTLSAERIITKQLLEDLLRIRRETVNIERRGADQFGGALAGMPAINGSKVRAHSTRQTDRYG